MVIDKDRLIDIYQKMVRIREFEERVFKEFKNGKIPGSLHLYSGEEACAVGACAALKSDDYITSTHRGHGHLIAKGGRTDKMFAELLGKKTGCNKGKGGSMHIADPDINDLGANGIVGGGIPIAGGAALAAKMKGTGQVVICFLGDGATNTTRFHEGVNLAAIWDLPVIYAIENNMYAESTPISDTCKLPNLGDRACSYGIPGVTVDGNDVLAVYEAVGAAVDRARKGNGPTLIEMKTYRFYGHFHGDTQTYRTKEEVEEAKKKDPIPRFEEYLIGNNILTKESAENIRQEILKEMDMAVKFAEESIYPEPEEVLSDVWA